MYNIALEYFIEKNTIEVLGEYISKKDFKIKLNKEQKKIKEDIF